MDKLKLLLGVTALLLSSVSNAAVITHFGYTHDTDTFIVTGGGLEWLQWDQTLNQSVSWFNGGTGYDLREAGWRLATNTEMSSLFNAFLFGQRTASGLVPAFVFDTLEDTYETATSTHTDFETLDPEYKFSDLFGTTNNDNSLLATVSDPWEFSRALFGEDGDNDHYFNMAKVNQDYTQFNWPTTYTPHDAYAHLTDDIYGINEQFSDVGLALVRSIPSADPPDSVPEPSILALFGAGLLGLAFARRRKLCQS